MKPRLSNLYPFVVSGLLLAGCKGPGAEPEPTPTPTAPEGIELLTPVQHLSRASMALRGTRPSLEELHAVQADPFRVADYIDQYLEDDRFGATVRDLYNEQWLMRTELMGFADLLGVGQQKMNESVHDAPLRLIEYIVMNDRPFSEIVTADYTLADGIVATVWGLDYDGADTDGDGYGDDWHVTAYTDGRPLAGILSDSALFTRHYTTPSNANRGRANQITKAFLCYDFLAADINIDGSIDLSDPDAVNDAVQNNPNCAGCHDNLDPLASFFWGYGFIYVPGQITSYPYQHYNPQMEAYWNLATGRPPAFFGTPGDRLDDLGALIAADESFSRCAVEQAYAYLTQTAPDDIAFDVLERHDEAFRSADLNYRALVRDIVTSPEFAYSRATDETLADDVIGLQHARPPQLERMFEDLTGLRWEADVTNFGDVPMMTSNLFGYTVLGGGIDSWWVTRGSNTSNTTRLLVLQAIASRASAYVIDNDPARLLGVDIGETDETLIRNALVDLHLRLFAEEVSADSEEVGETFDLYTAALTETGNSAEAWKLTLTAMFSDLKILTY